MSEEEKVVNVEVIEKVSKKKKVSKKRKKVVKFVNINGKEVKCLELKNNERVGDYSRRMVKKFGNSVKNEVLGNMVKSKFPKSKVNYKHIGWYKGDIKRMEGVDGSKWG